MSFQLAPLLAKHLYSAHKARTGSSLGDVGSGNEVRGLGGIVEGWLARAKHSGEQNVVPLSDEQRAVHVPRLVEDMALRLSKSKEPMRDSDAIFSAAAVAHGKLRYLQGYTPAMLVDESRILEVTVFGMLQSNLNSLDFRLLLPDVTAIADEVDAQLTQSIGGYMKLAKARADA